MGMQPSLNKSYKRTVVDFYADILTVIAECTAKQGKSSHVSGRFLNLEAEDHIILWAKH